MGKHACLLQPALKSNALCLEFLGAPKVLHLTLLSSLSYFVNFLTLFYNLINNFEVTGITNLNKIKTVLNYKS